MSLPYPYITNNQYHINTGSYLDQKETEMLVTGYVNDLWYGFGETDVIEMSVFDLDQNPLGWQTINSEKEYKLVTMTYLDTLDRPTEYTYKQLISDFTLYRNTKILVNPLEQLTTDFGITSGSYILTYNFLREMAGNPSASLVVKDISPSRTEIKLIPAGSNNLRYQAFCLKKFQVKDVAPLLLQQTMQCPYDQIYTRVKDKYAKDIAFLKQLLFLESDGAFVAFLKTLYEDVVVYTNPASLTQPVDRVKRTQGIKTYYQNLLLANYEAISDFTTIDDAYDVYAKTRVEQQFKPYGKQQNIDFVSAKQFLVEFFTTEFYHPITLSSKAAFEAKYYAYFKNAMNLGNNTMFTIIDHSYLDERLVETDPLTLLVKLKTELPDDVKIQTACWISNISIAPFVVNAIVRSPMVGQTIKISPANFTLQSKNVSLYNLNEQFTAASLRDTVSDQQTIDVNKKISELQVDYTDFSNFVVFSSAGQRVSNFKTKISSWYSLSQSLVTLEENSSQSLAAGSLYPQYALERGSLDGQMQEIVTSFDGYESYLFKSGSYAYDPVSSTFVSTSYVSDQDSAAALYDKSNRDSLINNTPDHIVLDDGNDAYLTFLNMVGHYFDNIYLYITNLPSEKTVNNDPTLTFSKTMIDYMLDSFGWTVGTSNEDLSVMDTYTTASSMMSSEDRTKAVRTRLLNTLPQIYKTKGTEEAIKLLLSCHGIPSDLLQIREYGVNDYSTGSLVTYTKRERSCLLAFSGSGTYVTQSFAPRPNIRTVEFKLLLKTPEIYPSRQNIFFVEADHTYTAVGSSPIELPAWRIGVRREHGNLGRVVAEIPSYVSASMEIGFQLTPRIFLTSSLLPIFDGEILNVRLRRNEPDPAYQYTTNQELVPSAYDLTVQRNLSGRRVFRCIDSILGTYEDNMVWDGYVTVGTVGITGSLGNTVTQSITFGGQNNVHFYLGNTMVWDVPIADTDFEVHCNDFSSFSYTGSGAETHLITRMDADEATNFLTQSYAYTVNGVYASGSAMGLIPNKSEYYSTFRDVYGSFMASGSWTGSRMALYNKPIMPIEIGYYNTTYYPLNPWNSSENCGTIRWEPAYPYEYLIKNLEKIYTTPSYGPNRFWNEKVKAKVQTLAARLDDKERSTQNLISGVQTDSNLLGLYLDPQDAKNRDIVKFYGNTDVVNLIADPSNMFSASYGDLKNLNEHYNSFGDRRVLYNELITLYKIYFNRDIFDSVKNVAPARSSVRTGILVEPTVLERPKYQHRPVFSESNTGSVFYCDVTASHYSKDSITKLMRFSGSTGNTSNGKLGLLFAEFNTAGVSSQSLDYNTMPANLAAILDISSINEANFDYPVNFNRGYYWDLSDNLQLGNYGSLGGELGYAEAIGVTIQEDLDAHTNMNNEEITFLVKKWDKYTIYFKSGSYVRTSNRNEDVYVSHSVWLYSLVGMTPRGYNTFFYTSSKQERSGSTAVLTEQTDVSYILGVPHYFHRANTAKGTANQKINTIRGTENHVSNPYVTLEAPFSSIAKDTYFEPFGGYPRNHYTHKRMQYSPVKFLSYSGKYQFQTSEIYVRGRQTVNTTIDDKSGLGDASLPVQTIQTSNVNLVKSDNVINQ